jgi:hypothetical protein
LWVTPFPDRLATEPGLHVQQAGDGLQIVLDAMMHLAKQKLALSDGPLALINEGAKLILPLPRPQCDPNALEEGLRAHWSFQNGRIRNLA